jgi:hypothetical protein
MALYWGLDSWTPTNFASASGGTTFYDRIVKKITPKTLADRGEQRVPYFWGRYIGAGKPIDARERDYLLSRGVGILLIYNNLTPGRVKKGETEGRQDAAMAITAADGIVTSSRRIKTWLYANVEGVWSPTSAWLSGWMKGMFESHYGGVGGFYCNTTYAPAFNKPFGAALETVAKDLNRDTSTIQSHCKLFIQNPAGNSGVDVVNRVVKFNPRICDVHPSGSAIWQASLSKYDVGSNMGGVDVDIANENGATGILWPT